VKGLRLWPAILIEVAYVAAAYGFKLFASTNVQSFVGLALVPLAAALLLVIWWLAASRAPGLDRLLGFVLYVGALAGVVLSQRSNGPMLLAYALPTMSTGLVVMLAATYRLRWPTRRWVLVGFIAVCGGTFAALRVETIGSNLAPIVAWRWSPTPEGRSQALPPAVAQGVAALPAQLDSGDWPGFRGPARDGRLTGVRFSTNWARPPREIWRRKVGAAWSSFAAVGDYLFTQEQRGGEELVTCYRAVTGEPVWVRPVQARYRDTMGLGPRATPAYDRGQLYAQGATGLLQCLEASTGRVIWTRDLAKDAATRVPGYGFASSPLVAGDRVIVFSGAGEGRSVIAYDRASGAIAWRAGHGGSGYSSPHLARLGDVPQVLMASDFGLQSFLPATGARLWEHAWKVKQYSRCIQPLVVGDDSVLLAATAATGSGLLRIQKQDQAWKVQEAWMTKSFRSYFNDCVCHQGHGYGFDGDRFACLDLKTGERRWTGQRYSGQVLLVADLELLLVLSEAGEVILVPATPDRFTEIARFKALSGKTWNHPVVAHGRLFVRNSEEAACFELLPVAPLPRAPEKGP
jgi:outer membrane protein assembly factor BamB